MMTGLFGVSFVLRWTIRNLFRPKLVRRLLLLLEPRRSVSSFEEVKGFFIEKPCVLMSWRETFQKVRRKFLKCIVSNNTAPYTSPFKVQTENRSSSHTIASKAFGLPPCSPRSFQPAISTPRQFSGRIETCLSWRETLKFDERSLFEVSLFLTMQPLQSSNSAYYLVWYDRSVKSVWQVRALHPIRRITGRRRTHLSPR